jgi:hypothetical protein
VANRESSKNSNAFTTTTTIARPFFCRWALDSSASASRAHRRGPCRGFSTSKIVVSRPSQRVHGYNRNRCWFYLTSRVCSENSGHVWMRGGSRCLLLQIDLWSLQIDRSLIFAGRRPKLSICKAKAARSLLIPLRVIALKNLG